MDGVQAAPTQQADAQPGAVQTPSWDAVPSKGVSVADSSKPGGGGGGGLITSVQVDDAAEGAAAHHAAAPPKTWWYPRMTVQHPCCTLTVASLVVVAMTAAPIALGHGSLTEETDYDWIIASGQSSMRMDGVDSAEDQVDGRSRRRAQAEVPTAERNRWSGRNSESCCLRESRAQLHANSNWWQLWMAHCG